MPLCGCLRYPCTATTACRNAKYGSAVLNNGTWLAATLCETITADALVVSSALAYLGLDRNATCPAAAVSMGAIALIRVAPSPPTSCASIRLANSSSVICGRIYWIAGRFSKPRLPPNDRNAHWRAIRLDRMARKHVDSHGACGFSGVGDAPARRTRRP